MEIILKASAKEAAQGNKEKFASYREAFARIKKAQEGGWYFEAVTLQESIICDRLQSHLTGVGVGEIRSDKSTLGSLLNQYKQNSYMPSDLHTRLDAWRDARNTVVHQFAKSAPGTPTESVENALDHARRTAADGDTIVRDVLNWFRKQRAQGAK